MANISKIRVTSHAFGTILDGRTYGILGRIGFNSQEKVDEISGVGNHNTALFWEYDTRLGRRWNIDPKPTPGISYYSVLNNCPIVQIDLLGDKPTPREAAAMASHVYGGKSDGILKGGWKVSSRTFGVDLNNEDNGFKSKVYQRTIATGKHKGDVEFSYVTAGTDGLDGKDWKNNAQQPLGLSSQYAQSTSNAISISNTLGKGTELTFAGHSLGGGLAAANAYATGRSALTFNASGVGPISLMKYGYNKQAKVDAYISTSDPLNGMQNKNPFDALPDVNGTRHYLNPTDFGSVVNGHSIDNLLKCFENNPTTPKPNLDTPNNVMHSTNDVLREFTRWSNWAPH